MPTTIVSVWGFESWNGLLTKVILVVVSRERVLNGFQDAWVVHPPEGDGLDLQELLAFAFQNGVLLGSVRGRGVIQPEVVTDLKCLAATQRSPCATRDRVTWLPL